VIAGIRTTNVLQRTYEEERRKRKVISRLFDAMSCLKLALSKLIRDSESGSEFG